MFLALPFEGSLTGFRDRLKRLENDKVSQPAWVERPLQLNPDLHPSLANTLGSTAENQSPVYWEMRADLRDALNKRAKTIVEAADHHKPPMPAGYGLVIKLTKSAQDRLGDDAPALGIVPIKIVDVNFYLSQTRLGQIVFELACGVSNPSPALIVEILHCLSHGKYGAGSIWTSGLSRIGADGQLGKIEKKKKPDDQTKQVKIDLIPAEQLSLFDYAKELVCPAEDLSCVITTPRAFTYVLASTDEDLGETERREIAARLARRLTSDYTPQASLEGVEFACPFEKITHACALEGGAALVTDCTSVDFLRDFVSSVGESAYLKLALLAHKEFYDLAALTQGGSIYIEHDQRDVDDVVSHKMDQMVAIRERILNFRLAHRFSIASFSGNHNMVHNAWRRAMGSEKMLGDIAGDVREAEAYLSHRHAKLAEARAESDRQLVNRRSSVLQATLGFLAGLEGTKAFGEIVISIAHWHTAESIAAGQLAGALGTKLVPKVDLPVEQIILEGSPFVVGLLVAFFTWRHVQKGGTAPQH